MTANQTIQHIRNNNNNLDDLAQIASAIEAMQEALHQTARLKMAKKVASELCSEIDDDDEPEVRLEELFWASDFGNSLSDEEREDFDYHFFLKAWEDWLQGEQEAAAVERWENARMWD